MRPLPSFDELHVISDLHIGGATGFQIFDQGELLAGLIDHLRERSPRDQLALLINGDFVDFLAEPSPRYFDAEGAVGKLQRMVGDPAFAPVFESLRQFVEKSKRTLIVNLGNHDLELALPWVRHWLLDYLSGGQDRVRGRIQFVFDGTGCRCEVGGAGILGLHGNEVDAWNVCDYEKLRRIGRDANMGQPVEPWTPNAGTKMVIDVMNEIKADYPFVDLLKPELDAVVPTLLALDPKAKPKLNEIFGIARRLTRDKLRRAVGFLGTTEADTGLETPANGEAAVDAILDETFGTAVQSTAIVSPASMLVDAEKSLKAGRDPMELVSQQVQAEKLGYIDSLWGWFRGKPKHEVLREALERVGNDQSFDLKHVDDVFTEVDAKVRDNVDFVVTGHTHLERALYRRAGSGYYYNSGTWVRLIRLTEDILGSPEQFKRYYNAFEKGTMAALDAETNLVVRRPAVVSITQEESGVVGRLNRVVANGDGIDLQEVEGSRFEKA